MAKYSKAPEVEKIANELIRDHHRQLGPARIKYIFRDKASKKNGKLVLGKASKVTGKYKQVTGLNFIIEIAEDKWNMMDHSQRAALVDHELSHCGLDDNDKWTIYSHDFSGFSGVLERHGFWDSDLKRLRNNMQQMKLFGEEERKDHLKVVGD